MTTQILINLFTSFIIYIVLAYSFKCKYSTLRFFDFSHAIIISLGSYLTYLFSILFEINLFFAVVLTIFSTILISLFILRYTYFPLIKRKAESWQMLIASLGVYVVLQNVVSTIWGDNTLSFRTWPVKKGHQFMGAYITDVQIITIVVSILLLGFSWLFLEKTNIGQKIKAISSNPELSSILGISKNQAVVWSFILGSGLAACAGILIAADTDMTPTMGFNWLLYGVVAMIIGGMGKLRYLVLGALLLATTQHLSAYYLDSKWMNATAYIILIVFLYFRPYGFSGQPLKKAEI